MADAFVGVGAEIGRVAALWRYPVKSMAPEPVPSAEVAWHGVAGDRRWAFVDHDAGDRAGGDGFPWRTIRERPDMVLYRPRFVDPARPDTAPVVVTTPAGEELAVTDPALAAELATARGTNRSGNRGTNRSGNRGGIRAMKLDRGTFDTLPLSLLTAQSVRGLGDLAGRPLDVGRFRPNLLIDAPGGGPFPEEDWIGCTLRIGDVLVRMDGRDRRCVVVNVDPATGERDPVVFRTIARQRRARLGVYGTTVRPGRLAVGDPVVVATLPVADPP